MTRTVPTRHVSGWTIGGGGRLVELFPLPPWVIITGRLLVWLVTHPVHVAAPAAGIACWVWLGVWWVAPLGAIATVALVLVGLIAWESRAGTARGLRAIVSGMSRKRKLKARWESAAQQTGLHAKGDSSVVPPLTGWALTQTGVQAVCLMGHVGKHARAVVKASDDLAAACYADRCRVKVQEAGIAVVRWDWGKHLGQTFRLPDVPPPSGPNLVSWGVTEDGGPAQTVANLSVLIGGASGSGKSYAAWAILAGYIAAGIPIRLRVLDPGRVEFDTLRKQLEKHGQGLVHQYETSTARLDGFWKNLDRALEARLDAVAAKGLREHQPTPDEPLDITLVDELLPYAPDLRSKGTDHTLGKVAFLGRKAGYLTIDLAQVAQVDTIGRARDVFPQRLCFRTMTPEATGAILGGYPEEHGGAVCSEIAIEDRGVGYAMLPEQKGYTPFRTANVTDTELPALAQGRLPPPVVDADAARRNSPHVLYRYWGRAGTKYAGQLLYVGKTNDLDVRDGQHRRDDWEWMQYAEPVEVRPEDHYPNEDLVLTAEALAIRRERPLFNKQHNGGNPNRVILRTAKRLMGRDGAGVR